MSPPFLFNIRSLLLLTAAVAGLTLARAADQRSPAAGDSPRASVPPAENSSDIEPVKEEPAEDPTRFLEPGEILVLRLSWGIFGNAGELRIETTAEETPEGPRFRVKIDTTSKGLIGEFYPVDTHSESLIDPETGRPLLIEHKGREGKRETHTTTVFDYETGRVEHTDHNRPERSGTAELPDEPAYDMFVTMMLARTWDLQPGEKRTVLSNFEDDIYHIEATAVGTKTIRTPLGRYEATEIELKQTGELKGFFRKGGTVRFWISHEEEPQIVRIELRTKAGTFVMSLVEETRAAEDTAPQDSR